MGSTYAFTDFFMKKKNPFGMFLLLSRQPERKAKNFHFFSMVSYHHKFLTDVINLRHSFVCSKMMKISRFGIIII